MTNAVSAKSCMQGQPKIISGLIHTREKKSTLLSFMILLLFYFSFM